MQEVIPMHPCGLAMDVIRSAYKTQMRLAPGSDPVEVRWFFPETVNIMPIPHTFGSNIWDNDWRLLEDDDQVGEVFGSPREWLSGAPDAAFGYAAPAGPRSYWNGGPPGAWTPLALNVQGVPLQCLGGPLPPPAEPVQTECCPDPIASHLWVVRLPPTDTFCPTWPEFVGADYDPGSEGWISAEIPVPTGGPVLTLLFRCREIAPDVWRWTIVRLLDGVQDGPEFLGESPSCDPFHVAFKVLLSWTGCSGLGQVLLSADIP